MPFFLIPVALKLLVVAGHHAAAAGAHQAVVAAAAYSSPHVLAQAGGHLAQTTLQAAIATGSVIAGATIIGGTTMAVIHFCNDVHAYRERNHLDPYGHRKQKLTDVERCTECSICGDFNLMVDVKGESKQENFCACGHIGWKHHKPDDNEIRNEVARFMKSVGWEASGETPEDFAKSYLETHNLA
jgi:hypothetical protein